MNKSYVWGMALVILVGCASGPKPEVVTQPTSNDSFSLTSQDASATSIVIPAAPLSLVVRELERTANHGIVLMNGLNVDATVGPFIFERDDLRGVLDTLAESLSCGVHESEGYYFLYPIDPIYQSLTAVSLEGGLRGHYSDIETKAAFGVNTPLYNAFALLSRALDMTILADNAVADARSGEVALGTLPLHETLEALLKSARVSNQMFRIECTDEYVFLHHVNNVKRSQLLINPESLTEQQQAQLNRRVSVTLPESQDTSSDVDGTRGAQLLGRVLESLSDQLGISIRTEPGLDRLPVNPMVLNGVRVQTALELLIRQWLLPEFAFEFNHTGIVIRHVGPETS